MQADGLRLPSAAQPGVQPHHIDGGKFQSLGFVDGHDAHHVFPRVDHRGRAAVPHLPLPDGIQKSAQSLLMKLEVFLQLQAEHPQVGLPEPPAGLRAVVGVHARAHQRVPQIFLRAHVPE